MTTDAFERLQTLVVARIATGQQPTPDAELVRTLARYAPAEVDAPAWAEQIRRARAALAAAGALDASGKLVRDDELARRIGKHSARTWKQIVDKIIPGLALGIAAAEAKAHQRLDSRDAWAAAIVARSLGLWTDGPPPSFTRTCDALVWRQAGLSGKPKRSPAEIRAYFIHRELNTSAGTADRSLRLLAAREVGAARADLSGLRDALVRRWLIGTPLGTSCAGDFATDVGAVAQRVRDGLFGERKVFIAAAWRELRETPAWASLSLDEFKQRLLDAHREGKLALARADLVAAMDPDLVAASETASQEARFHFIVKEAP